MLHHKAVIAVVFAIAQAPITKVYFDWGTIAANYLLVAVGIGGIVVAIRTLRKIERQTKATEDAAVATQASADASLKQANHLLTSERAWLTICPVNEGKTLRNEPQFYWEVINVGKTPARLITTQAVCDVSERHKDKLPDQPEYALPSVPLNKRILVPGDSMRFSMYWTETTPYGSVVLERKVHSFDTLYLLAYGYVKYLSVLSDEECESRFCEDFFFISKADMTSDRDRTIVFKPNFVAPAKYTEHT